MTHAEARAIVDAAWRRVHGRAPTQAELTYAQAIALLETGYGRTGQFAAMAARGQYNWGALERRPNADGSCPAGTAPGIDQGSVCFLVFPSDVEAAAQFIRTLTTRHWPTVMAMRGSPEDVATAMRVPPVYYEGRSGSNADRIRAYATAIRNAIRTMGAPIPAGAAAAAAGLGAVVVAGSLAAGAYWLANGRRW